MTLSIDHGLAERLRRELPPITDAVWQALRARFPQPDLVDAPEPSAQGLVRMLVELLIAGPGPDGAAHVVAGCRRQALLRSRAGRPQQELLDFYDYGSSLAVAQIWRRGRPGDHTELIDITGRAVAVLGAVQKAINDAYWSQARADRFGRRGRRDFAHALLTGRASPVQAQAAGVLPAQWYRTVVLRSADRTGRWRSRASEQLHDRGVLHCVLGQEVVLFEPAGGPGLLDVGRRLGLGAVAAGAAEVKAVPDLPLAVTAARLVASLALTVPLLDTVVSADQLPLELTLLQDEELSAVMLALAESIGRRPDLLETIQVLYQLDLNRTSTARQLGIARRTLSGRLARIHELTGLYPTSTRGIQILYTALTALSMRDAVGVAPGA